MTAVSAHAYLDLAEKYWILATGASMGEGYGPVVIAKTPMKNEDLRGKRVAIPGEKTTAALLVRILQIPTDYNGFSGAAERYRAPSAPRPMTEFNASAGVFALLLFSVGCGGVRLEDLTSKPPLPDASCVVVGFLGGRDRWDDEDKGVRRLALALRDRERNLFAETFENRRRDVAEEFVRRALADGAPQRRLVVYGQSFGGAAVVKLARSLERRSIEIALTVQIDSVGQDDGLVPRNVRFALNLYQSDGWFIRGEEPIRAEDPERTMVLGNQRFLYNQPPGSEIDVREVPWWKLIFRVPHARMDRDERVWDLTGRAIRAACVGEDLSALLRD